MTILAVIGGGIAGRSLLYQLAKNKNHFSGIHFYEADSFAFPCSMHSTAIVAPRGISTGLSPLGDLLNEGFKVFSEHFKNEAPAGVKALIQYTGVSTRIDQFKARYPLGQNLDQLGSINLAKEFYLAEENAFMIKPASYLAWLLIQSKQALKIQHHQDFVIGIEKNGAGLKVKTQNGSELMADRVVVCGGGHNRFWKQLSPAPKLQSAKCVQGSYLEFNHVKYDFDDVSLTLDGDNFIYHADQHRLLIGSTTVETHLQLPPMRGLLDVYERMSSVLHIKIPAFESGEIKVGLREKASKREPYVVHEGNLSIVGGFYKNGYSLSLAVTKALISHLLHGNA